MNKPSIDIDIFEYPLDSADDRFRFQSGAFFLPALRVDNRGRNEPSVRLWDAHDVADIDLSVLLNIGTRHADLRLSHPNRRFDNQVITKDARIRLVDRALDALDAHYQKTGRYQVVWLDYNNRPNDWPDRRAFEQELIFLFPTLSPRPPNSESYREPILVCPTATDGAGNPLFGGLHAFGVLPRFAQWVESRGFTVYIPDDDGPPEIVPANLIEDSEREVAEETGWIAFPIMEGNA